VTIDLRYIALGKTNDFFTSQELPQPSVDEELLTVTDAGLMQQDRLAGLITLLDMAMTPEIGETAVVDFAVVLFKVLGYSRRERVARTRVDIPFFICGEVRHAKTDVCLVDRNDIFLFVVQEDKRLENVEPINAGAQLVAEAVAAFNENNRQRKAAGLPPWEKNVSSFCKFVDSSLIACSPSGHAWHRHGWHVTRFLQNSYHRDSVDSYSPWDLSSRRNSGDLLLSTHSSSCPSA
jgi:hypothetical protein